VNSPVLREIEAPLARPAGSVGIAIAGGAENGGSGHAEPRTEMQWNGYSWRQFVAIDEIGSLNILIAPVYDTGK